MMCTDIPFRMDAYFTETSHVSESKLSTIELGTKRSLLAEWRSKQPLHESISRCETIMGTPFPSHWLFLTCFHCNREDFHEACVAGTEHILDPQVENLTIFRKSCPDNPQPCFWVCCKQCIIVTQRPCKSPIYESWTVVSASCQQFRTRHNSVLA